MLLYWNKWGNIQHKVIKAILKEILVRTLFKIIHFMDDFILRWVLFK